MKNLLFTFLLSGSWLLARAAPVANSDAASTPGKTAATFSVTANDTGAPVAATVDFTTSTTAARLTTRTVGGQGTFTVDDLGNVTFTPLATFSGTSSTTYFVRDAAGVASNRATITVTVGPITSNDFVLVTYQTPRTFQPTTNDVSSTGFDFLTLDLDLAQPGVQAQLVLAAGTLQSDGAGNVTFAPTAGFTGSVPDVTYTVSSAGSPAASSNVGTIQLRVGGLPFACSGEFYQISQVGATAQLFRLVRNTTGGTVNYTATLLYDTGVRLNSLALSGQDGYLYAVGINTSAPGIINVGQVYQFSQNGAVNLGLMPGLPAQAFNSATADNQGNYYLANNNTSTLYRADLKTFTAASVPLASAANCGDIAFDPTTGYLYASRYPSSLYRIDLASADAKKPVLALSTGTTGGDMGSIFFDASGTLYGASNQGEFFIYDLTTGQSTLVGTANTASQGDGASCAFPAQKLDVVKAAGAVNKRSATVFDVPFSMQLRNTSSAEDPNIQVNDFLFSASAGNTNVTFPGAASVTIVAGPAATIAGAAVATNAVFTGQQGNTGLLPGTQSLQAGQTAVLTFTARVTYPAGSVPSQAQNTAYASTASATPNSGYQQLSDGSLVSPDQVLATDRSTTGATLPSSPNADTPAPTIVNFSNATPLPVVLSSFVATAAGSTAQLAWTTASEVNNAYFGVERATAAGSFTSLSTVAGHGNRALGAAYSFVDAEAAHAGSLLYYRLRQVDTDGTASYSPVRVVRLAGAGLATVALYPNPAGAAATLDLTALPAGPCAVAVYDLAGRLLATYSLAGGQAHSLSLRALPLGVSLLRVAGQTLRLLHQE
ncbi:Ig-like domain-containing protein [Hymenobacter sp. H14-R3]|uniref:Ig-like domain-containing protein n=1 Tax=Hymenobacter sp. H14-R3 TaxID=3046308 RepID=UPI0024BAB3E6|nr:Ig-like domain-containing protein [Hymenobacter sp. H14-R3]MDJ0366658.1 Ig-like domain-containing protein [Hymenobacter sp. H14-R3]